MSKTEVRLHIQDIGRKSWWFSLLTTSDNMGWFDNHEFRTKREAAKSARRFATEHGFEIVGEESE